MPVKSLQIDLQSLDAKLAGARIKCIAIVHSGSAENMNKLLEASGGGEGFNLGELSLTGTRLQGFSHLDVKGQIRV